MEISINRTLPRRKKHRKLLLCQLFAGTLVDFRLVSLFVYTERGNKKIRIQMRTTQTLLRPSLLGALHGVTFSVLSLLSQLLRRASSSFQLSVLSQFDRTNRPTLGGETQPREKQMRHSQCFTDLPQLLRLSVYSDCYIAETYSSLLFGQL